LNKPDSPTTADLASPANSPRKRRVASVWVILGLLGGTHFLVDIIAGTTNPLWPILEHRHNVPSGGLLWAYVCWIAATSIGQLVFGVMADRRPCPWLIWVGPLLGILCVSTVGLAANTVQMTLLLFIGGLGIAGFHPEAAAMAGSLRPDQRSRAMAIFALCGYLGQSVGPAYSGAIVARLQLPGLTVSCLWATPALAAIWLAMRYVRGSEAKSLDGQVEPKPAPPDSRPAQFPFRVLAILLAIGALRILPALGVPLTIAYLLEGQSSSAIVGAVQSAFMAGIGLGAMACAAFLRPHRERTALWAFPLFAALVLCCLTVTSGWLFVVLVGLCGGMLGITMPVFISYGQQLIPQSQRVASSITMGVSWGIAGGLVAVAIWAFRQFDMLSSIFWFFALASTMSALLCYFLPHSIRSK
jgi:FSR family fosmidomycin resistance protein-like MFS transporter